MQIKYFFQENIELFFLLIYFFSLPIAHFAAVQSISGILFLLIFLIRHYHKIELSLILKYKNIIFVFLVLLTLSLISLFFTPSIKESLKEIKSELIQSFIVLFLFIYYIYFSSKKKINNIIYIIFFILLVHTIINIIIWQKHGGWPYRAGGLLDSGGGERFGIWATYMLSMSIALLFSKYKKIGLLLLLISIVSIIANQTRATFVSAILIFISSFFLINNKKVKFLILIFILALCGAFYNYSSKLSSRYNIKHIVSNFHKVYTTTPNKFQDIGMEYSTYTRLAMWKSVMLYRLKDPWIPQEYGRFLYGKSIKQNFKNQPENLPLHIYAQTHNEFIGMLYSLGVIGLVIFLYFLYYQLKISYQISKVKTDSSYIIFSIFVFLGTIGFIGSMMFGSFFGDSESKFFYPLYGILLGIHLKITNEKNIFNKSK